MNLFGLLIAKKVLSLGLRRSMFVCLDLLGGWILVISKFGMMFLFLRAYGIFCQSMIDYGLSGLMIIISKGLTLCGSVSLVRHLGC